ncbi:MAG TPA: CHAD domain-containing protein [Alphaproteobacteria bacterium]
MSELELELKSGDPVAVYDVALRLVKAAPLRIDTESKAERGYRLLMRANAPPSAVPARPMNLDPAMTTEDALQRFGRLCIAQVLRNERPTLAGDPEGVHQMRVATRRLRSVLSSMKRMIPDEQRRRAGEDLKWFGRMLTPARNWEMFVSSLLPAVANALPDRAPLAPLTSAAERCRETATAHARDAILSEHYTEATLRLLRWFEGRAWRDQPVTKQSARLVAPIVDVAPKLIERCQRTARKRSRRFAELTPPERHRLRIALKKLRYVADFLGSLYEARDIERFAKPLRALQDSLGYANDVRTAYELTDQMRGLAEPGARTVYRGGGIVLGWHEREINGREPKLRKQVRRFRNLDPFW